MNFMEPSGWIVLTRDCESVQIPSGVTMNLSKGGRVEITQSMGGTYTVVTDTGYMVRIHGKNADALGLAVPAEAVPPTIPDVVDTPLLEKLVWGQLGTVYDPEIPVNVVDLGLIYKCEVTSIEGGHRVAVDLTLTAPGCGMGDVLKLDAETKIKNLPTVKEAIITLVLEPAWNPSMMTEGAKLQLGMM